ncbi:MAG TPA: FtsX-like permease family protein, partial [Nitrospirota bacterium]|nr:FtsX-like permease family protein [Nitrospirota bacterium]
MRFTILIKRIILSNIKTEWFLTTLTVIGIALAIGLFMGVSVATQRAIASFEATIAGINPTFNYEIADSSGTDFPEGIYRSVRAITEDCLPFLSTSAVIPAWNEAIDIQGIYTVKAFAMPGMSLQKTTESEAFLKNQNGLLITKQFSDAHKLKKGNTFSAFVYDKEYRLQVVDIIDNPLVPQNRVYMDLGNFQEDFNKVGHLTRIEVSAVEKNAAAIGRVLPPGLTIEKKEKILEDQKALVKSFRYNLRFVTFLAVLVGVFLLYNAIFISVVKRRTEIGILRGLGMDRQTVVALFSIQGIILGLAGS